MAEREIVWTKTAEKQLQDTLEYWLIKNSSKKYPNKILKLVDEYIGYIAQNPESYRSTEHSDNRVCIMGIFSIYFKHDENRIYITCFWDNRRNDKKLKKLLS